MRVSAIVLAAGKGIRLKSRLSKPLVRIKGRPMLIYSLRVLDSQPGIREIIVVGNKSNLKAITAAVKKYKISRVTAVVQGGLRRQDSVSSGLRYVDKDAELVLVHDAARPFINRLLVSRLIKETMRHGAAIYGVAVKSTIKKADGRNFLVRRTISRNNLWEIQTPQVFRRDLILAAYRRFGRQDATDDAMLVEKLGASVRIVEGPCRNIKITTPEDLLIANAIAKRG